jgi:hypothetical protein
MKIFIPFLILNTILLSSCAYGPFYIGTHYGSPVSYGEGRHAGLDFNISEGTPIIAATEGKVGFIYTPCPNEWYCGGIFVEVHHNDYKITTLYAHLKTVYVVHDQIVKRGQLIGLSGANNRGYDHLHFVVCKVWGPCYYSFSHDPDKFWLDGKPQCYDPAKDYKDYSLKDMTLPIACGEYAKKLNNEIRHGK